MTDKIIGTATVAIGGPNLFCACGYIFDGTGGAPKVIGSKPRSEFIAAMADLNVIAQSVRAEVSRLQEAHEKAGPAVPCVEPRLRAVQ